MGKIASLVLGVEVVEGKEMVLHLVQMQYLLLDHLLEASLVQDFLPLLKGEVSHLEQFQLSHFCQQLVTQAV